jgi:trehalose synthase
VSADLQPMVVARGSLAQYEDAAGKDAIEAVRAAAGPVRGARVLHLSGARGGRVPELLSAMLPLAVDAGLEVEWRVLFGGPELQEVGAALEDGFQGAETAVEDEAWDSYVEACRGAAAGVGEGWDTVVLHDPALLGVAAELDGSVVWRCHVDASEPDPPLLERARPLAERCAVVAVPDESFAPDPLRGSRLRSAPPGIDPLGTRNLEPEIGLSGRVVRPLDVDLEHPFVLQLMRLDRWKDPHATIEAFARAREELPSLQLVVAAELGSGDTAGWQAAKEVSDYAGDQPGFHLLTSYEGVGDLELGALQRLARVGLQRALKEGFGLAASESLWKGTPVIGNPQGGLPLQVRDGEDGYLTDSPDETARRIVELVRDPGLAIEMGRSGREHVRDRFLLTHALEGELAVLGAALGATVERQ